MTAAERTNVLIDACFMWCEAKGLEPLDIGECFERSALLMAIHQTARFIHGQEIDGFQTDHCCDTIPIPNTLCVQHLQSVTPQRNRELQHQRRMIHLQVGLLHYDDIYGGRYEPDTDAVPFFSPPAWLKGPDTWTSPHPPF